MLCSTGLGFQSRCPGKARLMSSVHTVDHQLRFCRLYSDKPTAECQRAGSSGLYCTVVLKSHKESSGLATNNRLPAHDPVVQQTIHERFSGLAINFLQGPVVQQSIPHTGSPVLANHSTLAINPTKSRGLAINSTHRIQRSNNQFYTPNPVVQQSTPHTRGSRGLAFNSSVPT